MPFHPTRTKYQSMVTILIIKSSVLIDLNATTENIFPPKQPFLIMRICKSRDAQFLLQIYQMPVSHKTPEKNSFLFFNAVAKKRKKVYLQGLLATRNMATPIEQRTFMVARDS